jgi:TRAP-type C4-dicarboxylate transport system permease small subunit
MIAVPSASVPLRRSVLMRLHGALDRMLSWFENGAMVVAGIVMLAAMVLTAVDAVLRYAFNAPLTFQQYLTENYLLVAMTNLAFAWGFRQGGYIRIESLVGLLPTALSHALVRLGLIIGAGYISVLAWTASEKFLDAWRRNAVVFGEIDWPISWSWIWIPVGCGLFALRLMLIATGPARGLDPANAEDPV